MSRNVRPVDKDGRIIMKLAEWKKKNPEALYFDSPFEWRGYNALVKEGIEFEYQPTSIVLIKEFNTLGFKKNKIETIKVRKMVYTPDFFIKNTSIYLELKGFFYEKDKNRFKACQHELIKRGQHILLIMSDNELKMAISLIKNDFLNKKSKNIAI